MTDEQYNNSITTQELQLSWGSKFSYYMPSFFIPLISIMYTILLIKEGSDNIILSTAIIVIPLLVAYFLYSKVKSQLRFRIIEMVKDKNEILKAIEKSIHDFGWSIVEKDEKSMIINTRISFASWGEQITVLFDRNNILINCIGDIQSGGTLGALFKSSENIERIVEVIEKTNLTNRA